MFKLLFTGLVALGIVVADVGVIAVVADASVVVVVNVGLVGWRRC